MNNVIRARAKKLGFCCEFAMLTEYATKTREETRKLTKLSERTVQYSYAKLKLGTIKCIGIETDGCAVAKTCLAVPKKAPPRSTTKKE